MQLYIPDPETKDEHAAMEWWKALRPETRMVFLQAAWELEGCETPEQLEPHQCKVPAEAPPAGA